MRLQVRVNLQDVERCVTYARQLNSLTFERVSAAISDQKLSEMIQGMSTFDGYITPLILRNSQRPMVRVKLRYLLPPAVGQILGPCDRAADTELDLWYPTMIPAPRPTGRP